MAVIQEYYSSRFDPGAPALVSFLGGFMESRRELNQMAFKERLAGIDPRAAAMVEAAAIKRRTELEKLAQDAVLARESNDVKLKTATNAGIVKLVAAGISGQYGLAEKRTEVGEKAASREASRQIRVDNALMDAATKETTVATRARETSTSPRQELANIEDTVENALGGQGGIYERVTDPQAREAARAKLYAVARAAAVERGASADVLAGIDAKFAGQTPDAALMDITRKRSPKEVAGEIPLFGGDAIGTVASTLGVSRADVQAALRMETGLQPMAGVGVQVAPTTGQAAVGTAPAGAEVVGSMPAAPGATAPSLFEAEIAQAKALEEQARQQRLGGRGDVPYGRTEVGRANLLYGMPYYRSRPAEMELPSVPAATSAQKPTAQQKYEEAMAIPRPSPRRDFYARSGDAPMQMVSEQEAQAPMLDVLAPQESPEETFLRQVRKARIAQQMSAPPEVLPEVFRESDEDEMQQASMDALLRLVQERTEQRFGSTAVESMPMRK